MPWDGLSIAWTAYIVLFGIRCLRDWRIELGQHHENHLLKRLLMAIFGQPNRYQHRHDD